MKASKAIELLEPIPAEDFITKKITDEIGKCCVQGHLSRLSSANSNDYSPENCADWKLGKEEVEKLRENSQRFIRITHNVFGSTAIVNNDPIINGYTEPGIKDRVMHLLRDMDAAGY